MTLRLSFLKNSQRQNQNKFDWVLNLIFCDRGEFFCFFEFGSKICGYFKQRTGWVHE
jgi:hypothetical protein